MDRWIDRSIELRLAVALVLRLGVCSDPSYSRATSARWHSWSTTARG